MMFDVVGKLEGRRGRGGEGEEGRRGRGGVRSGHCAVVVSDRPSHGPVQWLLRR